MELRGRAEALAPLHIYLHRFPLFDVVERADAAAQLEEPGGRRLDRIAPRTRGGAQPRRRRRDDREKDECAECHLSCERGRVLYLPKMASIAAVQYVVGRCARAKRQALAIRLEGCKHARRMCTT